MFDNRRYMTNRVDTVASVQLIAKIWECIDEVKKRRELGNVQTFTLYEAEDGTQGITQTQTKPVPFMSKYTCEVGRKGILEDTIILVDNGEISTMMFADEYRETPNT